MTNTHDAEKVKRLVSISAITFDALKGFVMNLEKLPEWQKSALPDELEALYKKAKDELVGKSHTEYEQELKPCTLEENAILMGHDPKFDLPKIHETVYAYFCENGVLKRDLLFYNVLGRWSNWETGELLKVKVIRWWSLPKLNVDPRICSSGFGVEK